ncbi:MAG: TetR/AcrR family transcriptional regulator [Deltaproteobacteria bacterium]|nr:TetR/AcrR family transcriptional regulator [Deltaproteobacteria bacterium]
MLQLNKRQQQKKRTHERILSSAYELFCLFGINGTTTLAVAERAQVSHGLIFAHFKTRDELVAAVVGVYGERVVKRIHELVYAKASLRQTLNAHLTGLSEHEEFYARLVTDGPILPPMSRATLLGIQSATAFHLSQSAQSEMQSGHILTIPVHLLFNTWIGLIHHYLANRDLFAPNASVLRRCGPELLEHYLGLLAIKKP